MRNAIGTGVAIAVVVSVGLAAQSTSSTQGRAASTPQSGISVTGCVERADQNAAATTADAASADKKMFILTNVMPSGAASETTGTSGTASGSRSAASSRKFPLDADESKLTPHVGHRVEISGTFVSSNSTPGVAGAPKLKVDTLRMLASSCAQ